MKEAPRRVEFSDGLPKLVDDDEHDVGPNPLGASGSAETEPPSRKERCQRRGNDSSEEVRNDAGSGHLPLHVGNDISDLGTLLSLIQMQGIGRAHEFGPTLDEYAI